jgi:hypothetical protein
MKKPMNESEEQLAARRLAGHELGHAVERLLGAPQTTSEPIEVGFDWDEVVIDDCITFHYRANYRGRRSIVDFTVNKKKLTRAQLDRLDSFIARRQAGITKTYDLAWNLSWLLGLWLEQVQPELSTDERNLKVRQLLLAEPPSESPSEQSATPTRLNPAKSIRPGISPLLALLTKRERSQLRRSHQIEVEDLERESEQLYESLSQFAEMSEADFWPAAEAFNSSLFAHHEKVRQAGFLLNNPIGRWLAREAELGIERTAVEAKKIKSRQK